MIPEIEIRDYIASIINTDVYEVRQNTNNSVYPYSYIDRGINKKGNNNDLYGNIRINVNFFFRLSQERIVTDEIARLNNKLSGAPFRVNGFAYNLTLFNTIWMPSDPINPEIIHALIELKFDYNK